jgi:catechol 2,3-dioxygenase-like lactoylglutathione lyase family enzyme
MQLNRVVAFLNTAKPEESLAFFGDALGFTFLKDDGYALVFDVFGTILRISKVRTLVPAQGTVLGWEVGDIDEAVLFLTQKGVVFERYSAFAHEENGVFVFPTGDKVAWFKDPDGNVLSLSQLNR